jgi:hypothetical protein
VAQILPRFYQARADIKALKQLRAEVDDQPEAFATMRLPGDAHKARGVPIVGFHGGVGGHIPGTRPDQRVR